MNYLDEIAKAIRDEVPSDLLPEADDLDQLFRLYALLARAKREATTSADVHDAWAAWTLGRGDDHESVKPYDQFDVETKQEDEPFLRAIRAVARFLTVTRAQAEQVGRFSVFSSSGSS